MNLKFTSMEDCLISAKYSDEQVTRAMKVIPQVRIAMLEGLLLLGVLFVVSPAPAFAVPQTLTTAISGLPCALPLCPVHDSATLTGVTVSGGRIDYNLYQSGDCTGTKTLIATLPFTGSTVPDSGTYTVTSAGSWSFQAVYTFPAGGQISSSCEPFTVSPQPTGVPEFPIGLGALLLLAIPLLLFMKQKTALMTTPT